MKLDYQFLLNLNKISESFDETNSDEKFFVDFMLFTPETEKALSSMDNNSRILKKRKLFDMWKPLKQGGPVTVPWTVDSELNQTKIEDAIMELEKVLGCFSFPKVSISERSTTKFENGLLFQKSSTGCFSYMGRATTTGKIENKDGVPKTWQPIDLDEECAKQHHSIQHEILHALGVYHEMQRYDRDDYILLDLKASGTYEDQYKKIPDDDTHKMDFIYNPRSLMHYRVKRELATLRNTTDTETKGQLYGGITRITTEDALSLQELYCKNNEDKYGRKLFRDYQISDNTTCLLPDEVGVYRKIFPERLCDGTADCLHGEDELPLKDGGIVDCEWTAATSKGCCTNLILTDKSITEKSMTDKKSLKCNYTGTQKWDCSGNELELNGSLWTLRGEWSDEWSDDGKKCPPLFKKGKNENELSCELRIPRNIENPDHCQKTTNCHADAYCQNLFDKSVCICKEEFKGDGKDCQYEKPVNECKDGTHECQNAKCIDTRYSYECQCKDGFVKETTDWEERNCIDPREDEKCNLTDGPIKELSNLLRNIL